jgi:hypothetical protein
MPPSYVILDYNCYSYYDFEMSNRRALNRFEDTNHVFKFTRKFLLGDYNTFLKLKNEALNLKNPLFDIFKKQKPFILDSYQHQGLMFFLRHLKPLLAYSTGQSKSAYKKKYDLIVKHLDNNKNTEINETIYNIIQDTYATYIKHVEIIVSSDQKFIVEKKLEGF